MNLKSIGWVQAVRGLREGSQGLLLGGLALVLLDKLRHGKPERQLVYSKKLPVGSTIVVRHTHRGRPRIKVTRAGDVAVEDPGQAPE